MRLILPLLCIAALRGALAQDSSPGASPTPAPAAQASAAPAFKQVVYNNAANSSTLTLTGSDTLVFEIDGVKRPGAYTIKEGAMHVLFAATDTRPALAVDFNMPSEGTLEDPQRMERFNTEAVRRKAESISQAKVLAEKALSNAKQISLACRLYASDNDGKFPAKLEDLIPTYLQDRALFSSPLSANQDDTGFDYLGAGGTDSDDPSKILLRSKDTTPDGLRVIVYFDGSGAIKAGK